jgi:ectoine hydroxylase-related dioxygenase (phytanoyl-CoA dioxygenase family)
MGEVMQTFTALSPPQPLSVPLTPEQIARFNEDGVIIIRSGLSSDWLEKIDRAMQNALANPTMIAKGLSNPEKGYNMEMYLWKHDDDIRDVVFYSPLARFAQQLMGSRRVAFFYDQVFAKKAGTDAPTPWHHDLTFWPLVGNQICSFWIPTTPVTAESSGLQFVRGSHRWNRRFKAISPETSKTLQRFGLLPKDGKSLLDPRHDDVPIVEDHPEFELISADLEPGDFFAFHPLTLHGSTGNVHRERDRRALALRWLGDDVKWSPTPFTIATPYDHGLKPGDTVGGPIFPQVLPEPIVSERLAREGRPERPDIRHVARIVMPVLRNRLFPVDAKRLPELDKTGSQTASLVRS